METRNATQTVLTRQPWPAWPCRAWCPAWRGVPMWPARCASSWASRPGGGTDVLARVIGQKLGAMWNTSVLVENKPGATGADRRCLRGQAAARRHHPADGARQQPCHRPGAAATSSTTRARDFTPISMVGVTPNMLTCRAEQKVRTVTDVVALCRQRPGKISFGSSGIGSAQHLALRDVPAAGQARRGACALQGLRPARGRPDWRPDRLCVRHHDRRHAVYPARQGHRHRPDPAASARLAIPTCRRWRSRAFRAWTRRRGTAWSGPRGCPPRWCSA